MSTTGIFVIPVTGGCVNHDGPLSWAEASTALLSFSDPTGLLDGRGVTVQLKSQDGPVALPAVSTRRWPKVRPLTKWKTRIQLEKDRLKAAWAKFIGRMPWRHSVTLTFDPKKRRHVGQELASREAFRWLNSIAADSRSAIGWVYATERGRCGRWHIHALLTAVPEDVLHHHLRSWELRNGMVYAEPVYDTGGAVVYLTKDAALEGEIVLSDTIAHHRDNLATHVVVRLHDEEPLISV